MQQPEQVKEPEPEVPTDVAEQMKYRPTGLQRGPSPGSGNYVNPLAHRAVLDRQQEHSQQAQPEQPEREPTQVEKYQRDVKAQAQEQSAPTQKLTREQQVKALNEELKAYAQDLGDR